MSAGAATAAQASDKAHYTNLERRAAALFDQGRRTLYAIGYATVDDPARATHLLICLGAQWSGRRLYMVDLDSHTAAQDASAALAAFRAARPELAAKLDWHRSQSGSGWHALFESSVQIPTGKLYDQAGNHIGELLGADTDRTLDPGDVRIPWLHVGEVERLLNVWHVKGSDLKGERWADRDIQGKRWVYGYNRIRVSQADLRAHLRQNCGWRGAAADLLFDQREPFDRSAAFGRLVQTLMLHAHRIPGQQNTGFVEKCAAVMAYAMASDAYGKAGEKGYAFEKDAASLIAQIVNGDPYGAGLRWITPFWAKSHATSAPAPTPALAAPRPAHRPAGDRAKHLMTFRRVLNAIEPDDFGRRTYTLAELVDRMKTARCAAAPRTIQTYLATLRTRGEIVTAQIGGNGRPYAILKPCFGGADNSQKRVESNPKPDILGDANACAVQPLATPKSAESPHNAKEDHQNPSAPPARPIGIDRAIERDAAALAACWAGLASGQRRENPPAQARFTRRDGALAAKIARRKRHGAAPAPTPYRPRAQLVLETLPEPPGAAAPAGAQGAGEPLPIGLVERLRDLKAQRGML